MERSSRLAKIDAETTSNEDNESVRRDCLRLYNWPIGFIFRTTDFEFNITC